MKDDEDTSAPFKARLAVLLFSIIAVVIGGIQRPDYVLPMLIFLVVFAAMILLVSGRHIWKGRKSDRDAER